MIKYKLRNGLTVIYENRPSDSVTIQLTVNVGSNDEQDGMRGISHFIEHMVFEGTKKRRSPKEITNEIESLGGEINAYTDNIRTCFYIKVANKHFKEACDILSDIILNPIFDQKSMEKERGVILKEINIFNDDPRHFQWILFMSNLYKNHPAKYPGYGNKKDVKSITRQQILNYFDRYYCASNSVISIAGNVSNCKETIDRLFSNFKKGIKNEREIIKEPEVKKSTEMRVKRKMLNSYIILGHPTVGRLEQDSYALDVIQAVLGRGQSGRIFDEIRNKRGLAYEVGVINEESIDFGFFAVYLSADKKNIKLIKELIYKEFNRLSNITDPELKEAKGFIEGRYILDREDTHNIADDLGFWEIVGNARIEKDYLNNIRKVSKNDIKKVARKFLNKNYTLAVIEQK